MNGSNKGTSYAERYALDGNGCAVEKYANEKAEGNNSARNEDAETGP